MQTKDCEIHQDRLQKIEGEIDMLRDASGRQAETIFGLSLGMERINSTISRVIDMQEEHAKRLKDIEAISILSRHWKFFVFIFFTIVVISLFIHTTLKEVIGWVT